MAKRALLLALAALLALALLAVDQRRERPRRVSGIIETEEVRLGSRVGGRVQEVLVGEGSRVLEGAVLIRLEPHDLLARRARAEAALAVSEARLEVLLEGARPEEIAQAEARADQLRAQVALLANGARTEDLDAAAALVDLARAECELAEARFGRVSALVRSATAAEDQLDEAQRAMKSAKASLRARSAELAKLEAGTRPESLDEVRARLRETEAALALSRAGPRDKEIVAARAEVAGARAELETVLRALAELEIRSPLEGRIEAIDLHPGDLIAAGSPVISVLDDDELWIRSYLPAADLGLESGQELRVSVDAFPGRFFRGTLTFVSREAEFTPSNVQTPEERTRQVYRSKIRLLEGAGLLRPGMAADVWLESPASELP